MMPLCIACRAPADHDVAACVAELFELIRDESRERLRLVAPREEEG